MIIASIQQSSRVEAIHPLLKRLFEYVRTHSLEELPPGRVEISGSDLFLNVCSVELKPKEAGKLEVHRKYLDVHFPLSGAEIVGWSPLCELERESDEPFDQANDFALYSAQPSTYLKVAPGQFWVAFPEDAHAPALGEGVLKKVIAKVKL